MPRKFFKTILQVEILSEDCPFDSENLSEVHRAITDGACSGVVTTVSQQQLTGRQMAHHLIQQDSDPEFFQLDENGKDLIYECQYMTAGLMPTG